MIFIFIFSISCSLVLEVLKFFLEKLQKCIFFIKPRCRRYWNFVWIYKFWSKNTIQNQQFSQSENLWNLIFTNEGDRENHRNHGPKHQKTVFWIDRSFANSTFYLFSQSQHGTLLSHTLPLSRFSKNVFCFLLILLLFSDQIC